MEAVPDSPAPSGALGPAGHRNPHAGRSRPLVRGSAALAAAAAAFLAAACVFPASRRPPEPFEIPVGSRLVLGLPFYPDDTRLCGPASLAAVMNYMGYPVTLEEAAEGIQRWDIKGSLGPDLVLWARSQGAKASFRSGRPEDLVDLVNRQIPAVVLIDQGIGPVVAGHFMTVAGYSPDGIVVNSGLVQQEIMPWSKFLTQWYKMGNFMITVGHKEDTPLPSPPEPDGGEAAADDGGGGGEAAP
ncbi:MAG: C39 family peptidase [Deltaproteobacteria bacterium]|jgi:hypothetical protein|nr:C39 family peptidase [Deltaproteobacteria bacterium]